MDRMDTDHKTFVGVLSLLIFIATIARIGVSFNTGLYTESLLILSIVGGFVGITASIIGARISDKVTDKYIRILILSLVFLAGVRLLYNNLIFV